MSAAVGSAAGGSSGPVGPLRAVLAAFDEGSGTLHEVGARTGLDPDVVRAAVDHLVRMGHLSAEELAVGCPSGGCSSCASAVDATPGCGAAGPTPSRSGPVLVALTRRRTPSQLELGPTGR